MLTTLLNTANTYIKNFVKETIEHQTISSGCHLQRVLLPFEKGHADINVFWDCVFKHENNQITKIAENTKNKAEKVFFDFVEKRKIFYNHEIQTIIALYSQQDEKGNQRDFLSTNNLSELMGLHKSRLAKLEKFDKTKNFDFNLEIVEELLSMQKYSIEITKERYQEYLLENNRNTQITTNIKQYYQEALSPVVIFNTYFDDEANNFNPLKKVFTNFLAKNQSENRNVFVEIRDKNISKEIASQILCCECQEIPAIICWFETTDKFWRINIHHQGIDNANTTFDENFTPIPIVFDVVEDCMLETQYNTIKDLYQHNSIALESMMIAVIETQLELILDDYWIKYAYTYTPNALNIIQNMINKTTQQETLSIWEGIYKSVENAQNTQKERQNILQMLRKG